jgi:thioesterase domain-containing protein
MDSNLKVLKQLIEKSMKFCERMGLKVLEIEPHRIKLSAPIKGNENHINTMYAGAIFTIAEIPGGALVYSAFDGAKFFPILKDMYIKFTKTAKTDITVEASLNEEEVKRLEKEAEKNGKANFYVECEVKDAKGEIVAISKGLYQIRKM